jgi:membrane-associated protease RseP (regulator of RpoE activity)
MLRIVGIVAFALVIFVSVCLHEAGHMLTAKSFGMKVTRYFAGFGPTLWSFKRGETEYGLKAIPLGGFVKIVGMTPQDDDVEPGDENRAMWRFPVWKRTIVMAAGSITHFIIAFVLLWIAFAFLGMPNPEHVKIINEGAKGPTYIAVQDCVEASATRATCIDGDKPSPAKLAGLQNGDQITSVGTTSVTTYEQLVRAVRAQKPGVEVPITYIRGGQILTTDVTLIAADRVPLDDPTAAAVPTPALGISSGFPAGSPDIVRYNPIAAIPQAGSFYGTVLGEIGTALKALPSKIPGLVHAIEGKPRDPNGPLSVVGASELGGQTAELGLWYVFVVLAASLNVFVGVFNLLPLLPLDGGHIAIAWYEKIRSWFAKKRRKPEPGRVDYFKLMPLTYAVIVVFGGFSLLTIFADIINPIDITK